MRNATHPTSLLLQLVETEACERALRAYQLVERGDSSPGFLIEGIWAVTRSSSSMTRSRRRMRCAGTGTYRFSVATATTVVRGWGRLKGFKGGNPLRDVIARQRTASRADLLGRCYTSCRVSTSVIWRRCRAGVSVTLVNSLLLHQLTE